MSGLLPTLTVEMTTNEKIREQSFCYDADLPPSIPAGQPLRSSRPCRPKNPLRRGLRRLGRRDESRPRS